MRFSFARIMAVAAVLAGTLGFGAVCNADGGKPDPKSPPEIKAESFINADSAPTLAAFKGKKPVLVEFWATWCPPCRRSIPHLNELHEKYGAKLVIVGLTDEDKAKVEAFQQKQEMKYIVGVGSTTFKEYGVRGIPAAFLIGVDGTIVWSGHPMDEGLNAAIEKATAEVKDEG